MKKFVKKGKCSRICAMFLAILLLLTTGLGQLPVQAGAVSENTITVEKPANAEIVPIETANVETAMIETANVETAAIETTNVETATIETTNAEIATIAEIKKLPMEKATVNGSSLLKDYEVRKDGQKLESGNCVINETDELEIYYQLKDLLVDSDNGAGGELIENGNSYTFQVPEILLVQSTSWEVSILDHTNQLQKLGTAVYDASSHSITLTMDNAELFSDSYGLTAILDAYIGFHTKLNEDVLGTSNGEEKTIDFGFGSPTSFSFTYGESGETDTSLSKTVSYNESTGIATWTIQVTDGSKSYTEPLTIKDTMSKEMTFVSGSFTDNGSSVADSALNLAVNSNTGETTFQYPYSPTQTEGATHTENTVHTFTYQSKYNHSVYIGQNDGHDQIKTSVVKSASNTAMLTDASDNKISEDTESVPPSPQEQYSWNEKTVERSYNPATDIVTYDWKVTVNTNGYTFKNVIVQDVLAASITNPTSEYSFLTSSMKITKVGNTNYTDKACSMGLLGSGADANIMNGTVDGKLDADGNFVWAMILEGGAETSGTYTITYQTQLTNYSEYRKYNQVPIKNGATIKFDWVNYEGPGDGTDIFTTTMIKQAEDVSETAAIGKNDGIYNKSTHEISWHITLNATGVLIDDISVRELLNGQTNSREANDLTQSFVRLENLKVDDTAATDAQLALLKATQVGSGENAYVNITFGEGSGNLVNGHKVEFDVITKLEDADYYESNTENLRRALNSAVMYQGNLALSTVDASCYPSNEVLYKYAGDYDYSTKKSTWNIEVNKDEMALKDATIVDVLTTGNLVEGSLTVDGALVEKGQQGSIAPYYTLEEATNTLTVYLGDITSCQLISYQTALAEDTLIPGTAVDVSHYNGDILLKNEALLKKSSSASIPSATANKTVTNNLAKKSVGDGSEKNTALYTILLNHAQIEWNDSVKMTDIMSSGMTLNIDSINLYKATIHADGSYTTDTTPVDKSLYEREITILGAGNSDGAEEGATKFVFTLPKNSGTQAYVLTYKASLDEDSTKDVFTNTLTGSGVESQASYTNVAVSRQTLSGYGGGVAVAQSRVRVYKYNADGTISLEGAVFGLFQNNQLIAQKTTNASGYCTFGSLVPGEEYYISELAAPEGYVLDSTPKYFTAEQVGNDITQNMLQFRDEKESFHIQKTDENQNALADAKFGLFGENETQFTETNAIEVRSSGTNGNIEFITKTPGLYPLVELEAPSGYSKTDKIFMVEIGANGEVTALYEKGDDTKATITAVVNKKTVSSNTPEITTNEDQSSDTSSDSEDGDKTTKKKKKKTNTTTDKNTNTGSGASGGVSGGANTSASAGTTLPKTGRENRMLYVLSGLILLVTGSLLYQLKGRRKHENES